MGRRKKLFPARLLFLDEHFSDDYCPILDVVFGMDVRTTKSVFGPSAQDQDWIPRLKIQFPHAVLFAADYSMSRTPLELNALVEAKLPYILAINKFQNRRFEDQVWAVIKFLPAVIKEMDQRPAILLVDFIKETIERKNYLTN